MIVRNRMCCAAVLGALSVATLAAPALANDRHFTFAYETATLSAGSFELEPWMTVRAGREHGYLGIDYRLEFEAGITDRLQTALYLNGFSEGERSMTGDWGVNTVFDGVSSEWKFRVLTQGLHPFGLALYGEVTIAPDEVELEAKVLVDRRFGRLLLAANAVVEHAWEFSGAETQRRLSFDAIVAAGWFFTPRFMVGLEARNLNIWSLTPEVTHSDSVFFAGPTVAYSSRAYWIAASALPQLGAAVGSSAHEFRNLTSQEMVNLRVLMGAHF